MRQGTYSIVARDAGTGEVGVAVQSHWFSVGQLVPWVEPGVGAVAIQAIPDPPSGARLLDLMRGGAAAGDALRIVLEDDDAADYRQTGVVDSRGGVAAHTGPGCIFHASGVTGDGYSCQANMMARETVPEAMARAFESSAGEPLAERLVRALTAAEEEGGDLRGRQSAALLTAPPEGEPWRRAIDLRVEDHGDPVPELARLLILQRAYDMADRADQLAAEGEHSTASDLYERAGRLAPESDELLFWAGLGAAQVGDMETGLARVRAAIDAGGERWVDLLGRLTDDLAPSAAAVLAQLRASASDSAS